MCTTGPNVTIDIRSGGRDEQHFFVGRAQEAVMDVRIVTSNNVTAFQVRGLRRNLKEGEVVVKPKVYYPFNYTTVYTIIIPSPNSHESYRILYRVEEINIEMTAPFYLTRKQGMLKFIHQ